MGHHCKELSKKCDKLLKRGKLRRLKADQGYTNIKLEITFIMVLVALLKLVSQVCNHAIFLQLLVAKICVLISISKWSEK